MAKVFFNFNSEVAEILKRGGVGVMPTDTIYGIVGSAMSRKAVSRIYKLRKRRPDKPMIILLSSKFGVRKFGARLTPGISKVLNKMWPGKVSIILHCPSKNFWYLHRGTNTLAFRVPRKKNLIEFLKKTGPLVAPSANLEGKPPAKTIREARRYFGGKPDFYVDGGKIIAAPSAVAAFRNGKIFFLRKSAKRK